jgi:hypothetical protein
VPNVQTISIFDSTPPSWNEDLLPASTVLECSQSLPPGMDAVSASDNCQKTHYWEHMASIKGDLQMVTLLEENATNPTVPYLLTVNRTWIARDYSDNSIVHSQIIQVRSEPPGRRQLPMAVMHASVDQPSLHRVWIRR